MTIKRMTKNRRLILDILSKPNSEGRVPPFTTESIQYEAQYGYGVIIATSQINRTLRELVEDGIVIFELRIIDAYGNNLPQKVKHYQLATDAERNVLLQEIKDVLFEAHRANGVVFLGGLMFQPWTQEERAAFIPKIRSLIQKTHPDKVSGFEDKHIELVKALDFVRTEIDLLANPVARNRI